VSFQLRRGMKQGDLLYPLFNSTLDPIVERINDGSAGMNIAGENIAILAFADIIFLSRDAATVQKQLDMLKDERDPSWYRTPIQKR